MPQLPSPLSLESRLSPQTEKKPLYARTVKNIWGEEETLADPRAVRALVALMNQHAVIGGAAAHWGGPAAFAEIMSSIHAIMYRQASKEDKKWFETFNFVNDAGHTENGVYALRSLYQFDDLSFNALKGFRSLKSKLSGHGEAHLNPEHVYISNGPLGSGVAQAQGLAMADKLSGLKRVTLLTLSDGGSMEGEAKEALTAIPGLAKKGKINPFITVISDNNTKLSGRIDADSFEMNSYFASLEILGWNLVKVENGHSLEEVHLAIETAVEETKKTGTPQCLWVKTVKGKGVQKTEKSSSGGHGYPLKAYDPELIPFIEEIYAPEKAPEEFLHWAQEVIQKPTTPKNETASGVKKEKVQPGFARAAIEAVEKGIPLVSLSADLQGSTGIAPFHAKFPKLSFDLGVAESNMISAAIGFSKAGYIPVVDTFAQFGITKGKLPLIMASLSQGPVIALFSHIGFQDAADGASHQATTYLAALSAIPHLQVISVSCSSEAQALMTGAIDYFVETRKKGETPDSIIFFFGREDHPVSYVDTPTYPWQKAQTLKEGTDATIISSGPMISHALEAVEKLESEGYRPTLINHPFANRPDLETIKKSLEKNQGRLITIEDHQVIGGMGAQIIHRLAQEGLSFKAKSLGNQGHFGQSAYTAKELYQKHGMDADAIIKTFKGLIS